MHAASKPSPRRKKEVSGNSEHKQKDLHTLQRDSMMTHGEERRGEERRGEERRGGEGRGVRREENEKGEQERPMACP
jgi:hypothetical protein